MLNRLLRVGVKVKVHPIEWIEKYVNNSNISSISRFSFVSDMKQFCGKYVTIGKVITNNSKFIYSIIEDNFSYTWLIDYFDLSTISIAYSSEIKKYCSTSCLIKDECNFLIKCPLYKGIEVIYDYDNLIVKYRVKVNSLEWFVENCVEVNEDKSMIICNTTSLFTLEMQKFCNNYVTITEYTDSNGKISFEIEEDKLNKKWSIEFFNIFNFVKVKDFCNNYCIFGGKNCKNPQCPLFSIFIDK